MAMECDVCSRDFSPQRRPFCVSCAQAILYEPRILQASALLDCENAHTHVEAVVRPGNDGILAALPQDADWDAIANGIKKDGLSRQRGELQATELKINAVVNKAEMLRRQLREYQEEIEKQKAFNERRRLEIASENTELERRRIAVVEPLQTLMRKSDHRLQKVHLRAADARAHLCYNAGRLAGLRQEKNQRAKLTGRIVLGGLAIPDLRELNDLSEVDHRASSEPEHHEHESQQFQHVNACLDNICRLVGVWAHYLSISAPAEVFMPHANFPHSAILPEKSSYKGFDPAYSAGLSSQSSSPSASRLVMDARNLPRLRLLHLDRPLAKLAKDDPKTFGLFIEGVMLLAWNVAWLCKTQGIGAINTFDEVCDIGRNTWLLYRAAESTASKRPQLQRLTSPPIDMSPSKDRKSPAPAPALQFGVMTHGTVQHSLAGFEGGSLLHNWRLAQPHRLVDKLRNFLLTEMTGAEWDVLSERDFDDERADEVAVLVGGTRQKTVDERRRKASIMTAGPIDGTDAGGKGGKGWTKVRGRNDEM